MIPTATRATKPRLNYDAIQSPEHASWRAHREMCRSLPWAATGRRGCIGLALLIRTVTADSWTHVPAGAGGELTFVPDKTVAWASLVDVPCGGWTQTDGNREVAWATVRPSRLAYGMPCLASGDETAGFDLRRFPFDAQAQGLRPSPDVLRPAEHLQLFRVFNDLNWAMTSFAAASMPEWSGLRPAVAAALGYDYDPTRQLFAYGGGVWDSLASPSLWMPKPYIAFPEYMKPAVHDRAVYPAGVEEPFYSAGLRAAFADAVGQYLSYHAPFSGHVSKAYREMYCGIPVLTLELSGDRGETETVRFFRDTVRPRKPLHSTFEAGEIIAEEATTRALPANWYAKPAMARFATDVPRLIPHYQAVIRLWFERQAVSLSPGLVHYPAQIASVAAKSAAVDGELFWEVRDALEYYVDESDALVFPPVPLGAWHQMSGFLPGDVKYDLTPADPRYVGCQPPRRRRRSPGK